MASKTFYLKYRPQKISELDLVEVREGLKKVLASGRVPHALLFVGPRGTGKTSAARIFAKAINCEKVKSLPRRQAGQKSRQKGGQAKVKSSFEPCNRCTICKEITTGSALDLLEIDAASNRGIDNIRDLREKIRLSPVKVKYKVYIIDEVHMLTTEAFNALLKTLEEPPAHAVFILCTTEPQKLPETIISRCLRFNFKKAKVSEVVGSLEPVVKEEKLKVEKGVLEEIARSVDGSFRDAKKILEQLSFGGRQISLKETKELLGKAEALSPEKLLSFLAQRDTRGGLGEIDRVVGAGADLAVYVAEILGRLRLLLLAKAGLDYQDEQKLDFSLEELKALIRLFSRAAQEMKTNPIPQLPLELVVVEWGDGDGGDAEIAHRNFDSASDSLAKKGTLSKKTHRRSQSEASQNLMGSPHRQLDNLKTQAVDESEETPASPLGEGENVGGNGLEEVQRRWGEVLAGVRPMNHSVEALLRAARPAQLDGDFLTLEVFYKFHKERLESQKCRSVVEEIVTQVLGSPVKLRCVLGQKFTANESAKSSLESAPLASPARFAVRLGPPSARRAERAGGLADDDIMKTAEEIFGAN